MSSPTSKEALRSLYKQLLRKAATYPSKNREGIYQAIREEWRDHIGLENPTKIQRQIHLAYQGLGQLSQFDEKVMGGGNTASPNWSVQMEQNPMPKPDDYDEKKQQRKR